MEIENIHQDVWWYTPVSLDGPAGASRVQGQPGLHNFVSKKEIHEPSGNLAVVEAMEEWDDAPLFPQGSGLPHL
jgi:hypothetical protein